ncbi:ATP-grasp domain-containing protein [Kribbella sancticallisti]|uniref:ATP-grasp domain-containing protein n=1 Tax=Kribbella sancticallisti TaxID=460087 RepID=A0ABN2EAP1_9ACTN
MGTFDAEAWWRPRELAALPAIGGGSDPAVDAMDELLAGFCEPGDLLITRRPMAAAVREGLGFTFDHLAVGDPGPGPVERHVLGSRRIMAEIRGASIKPYAVLPETWTLAEQLLPAPEVVAEVNSKSWSNDLVRRLGLPGAGRVVRSTDELVEAVTALGFRAVVKDPYGVSGRALLDVPSPGVLKAIERVLRRQVDQGLRVELLVQQKFRKQHDFSGHLEIALDGTWEFLGIQQMTNRGFRHFGSSPAPPSLIDPNQYAETLAQVVPALTKAGYSGPVGVDSMILEDGTLIPILEINARQSLGLLAVHLHRRATQYGLTGHLWQLELNVAPGKTIDDVFTAFGGILHQGGSTPGIVVLNGSTIAAPGGRVYVAIFCPAGEIRRWRQRLLAEITTAGLTPRGMTDAA